MNKLVLGLVFVLIFTTQTFAWGPRAHKIVAQIAKAYLDKSVIDSVDSYLDDITFEKAAYWMDEVVMNSNYDFMVPWHFIAIESDKTYVKSKNPDIINVLENVIITLKRKKGKHKEVFLSLKILFHLMGDIHQPLHCGFTKDKGGKDLKVRFFFKATNLHDVWDGEILEYLGISTDDCLKLGAVMHKNDIIKYQRIDVLKWMEESRALLGTVYDYKDSKLGDEYLDKAAPVIKMQLFKAGIRLAAVLNQTFKR